MKRKTHTERQTEYYTHFAQLFGSQNVLWKNGINEMEIKNVYENSAEIFRLPKYIVEIDIGKEVG